AHGHTLKLPMDRGEGQHWNRAPGNLYSAPMKVEFEGMGTPFTVVLGHEIPPIEPPEDTKYVRHVRIQSDRLSEFWGRPMHLGAHVLVPEGFDEHPEARYPLMIFHGHYPSNFGGFRPEPPDPDLEPDFSERFGVEGYNRMQQQEAHDFYRKWISEAFPRFLIIEIQHANPFYDDSYAVNSANVGPYGDAITYELLPHIEERFRGIGEGWARFLYGGSTGGWEALAAQVFYPDEYNGCFAACPDPIDFRAFCLVDLYEDENAYWVEGPFGRIEQPARRDSLGRVNSTMRTSNHMELALGTKTRSGDQFDVWEAVYSPVGPDGYPARIWDKRTGKIDREVAAYWRENYDLRHILQRDWETLAPRLAGKIHIYCGDMDNYYLNNAVYRMEDFLESADPPYGGVVDYGDRAEHCWNGDHENGNHVSRLRYNTMYLPRILERIEESAPPGADLSSWRY
ncbi:MAG: alpha/beta hydrolase-fold protein, partial [Planctomycetota bacterium]